MPPPEINTVELIAALAISLISGAISIARRILRGHPRTLLWIVTEFLTAILCGYLMYNSYDSIQHLIPKFITLPVAVAVAAHSGGRIFQELERVVLEHYGVWTQRKKTPPVIEKVVPEISDEKNPS